MIKHIQIFYSRETISKLANVYACLFPNRSADRSSETHKADVPTGTKMPTDGFDMRQIHETVFTRARADGANEK